MLQYIKKFTLQESIYRAETVNSNPRQRMSNKHKSIKGRFVLLVVVLAVSLFAVAVSIEKTATSTINRSNELNQSQHILDTLLTEASEHLNQVWVTIYQSSYLHDSVVPEDIHRHLIYVHRAVDGLMEATSGNNTQINSLALELNETVKVIDNQINTLLEVQKDVERRYPAMPIMLNQLQPANAEFMGAIVEALNDTRSDLSEKDRQIIHEQFRDIRYIWSQLISSVRVFVANRLGAFGPPEKLMEASENNRNLYAEALQALLLSMETQRKENKLSMLQEAALDKMQQLFEYYEVTFDKVAEIYYSETWRADHLLMRDGIDPMLAIAQGQIKSLKDILEVETSAEISQFANITNHLSEFIWIMVAFVIVLLGMAYIAFESFIRRPILQVAQALDAEAAGETYIPKIGIRTTETAMLIDAFSSMQKQVRSRQTRLQAVLDNAGEGIIIFKNSDEIESINVAGEMLFGTSATHMCGRLINEYIPDIAALKLNIGNQESPALKTSALDGIQEANGRTRSGELFPLALRLGQINLEGENRFVALVSDMSERHAMICRLTDLAERDSLTGLYNRHFLMDELERVVERANRKEARSVALLYIDLDNFKYVNDTLGHLAGDKVLNEITNILKKRSRGADVLARLGGDEFAALLFDLENDEAKVAAEDYRKQLAEYIFVHEGTVVDIGCSIGVAMLDESIRKKEELLVRADLACHIAKREGKNRIHVYHQIDKIDSETMSADMGWARRIKDSLENNQFIMACQPIMDSRSEKVVSYEILLRMRDQNNGQLIMPSGFLPSAQRFGLSTEIDRWVIKNSMKSVINDVENDQQFFSINLTANSICDHSVLRLIEEEIDRYALNPNYIIFELTENVAIANINAAARFMDQIRDLGCKTALDDFGVGYSSFSYLKDLPVDYVKIDGSFVRNVVNDSVKRAIVSSMNDVAHALGAKTVAEFVEDKQTFDFLKEIEVDLCQGYYIGKPGQKITKTHATNVVYL